MPAGRQTGAEAPAKIPEPAAGRCRMWTGAPKGEKEDVMKRVLVFLAVAAVLWVSGAPSAFGQSRSEVLVIG